MEKLPTMFAHELPEVFSARDLARAAGVAESDVRALVEGGEIRTIGALLPGSVDARSRNYIPHAEAVRVVRALRRGDAIGAIEGRDFNRLLAPLPGRKRPTTVPMIVSTSLHGLVAAAVVVITSIGFTNADERTDVIENTKPPVRMVYLMQPGPGGGGGGGGLKMRTPPTKSERKGEKKISSPLPARKIPPPLEPKPTPVEPPPAPLEAKVLPPVMAPIAPVAADTRDREGDVKETPKEAPPSQGPGTGGGAGVGKGTGLGEGDGSGIGPGQGGGMGGGPYRPGSGVEPPRLLKEVRANYTDEARRANITGEVVLEIVVRRDGSVGDIKMLRRLGSGLDQRAIDAVRQWRFAPARMKGTPVDVIVEVAVEFKLR
jgi:TonB family protein